MVTETKIFCPALKELPHCENMTCTDCQRLREFRVENDAIAERVRDYWKYQNSGAEPFGGD
jgi:hypothetical protein